MAVRIEPWIKIAHCEACGERGQETLVEQWSGDPEVPPWHGETPRCGFCFEKLVPTDASDVQKDVEAARASTGPVEIEAMPVPSRRRFDRYVMVRLRDVLRVTTKAILCRQGQRKFWVPKSLVESPDKYRDGFVDVVLSVADWFAQENELVCESA